MALKSKDQAAINSLRAENTRLKAEIGHLKRENDFLRSGGSPSTIRQRQCIRCGNNFPDGPEYFPGYLEEASTDLAAEQRRYWCICCRI